VPEAGPQSALREQRKLLSLALAAAALTVFWPAAGFDFVSYDDWLFVRDNPFLREGLSRTAVMRAFRETYEVNWIPLTRLSYHLDAALFGSEPRAFHATNVLLHALASVLLFLALARMSAAVWPSAFVAAVFAVHPLQVEPVAWISARKDVLSGACFAASLLAYARYAERPSFRRYAVLWVAACAGLLAKPMLVTLPAVLLLLDAWPLRRLFGPSGRLAPFVLLEKLPLLLPALAVAAVTAMVQPVVGSEGHAISVRVANAIDSLGAYLRVSFWPSGLAVLYPHPGAEIPAWRVASSGAVVLALTIFAALGLRRRPAQALGWLWFLGMLVPVIGLVEVGLQARADRYLYLPLIGLAIMVAWGGMEIARRRRAASRAVAFLAVASLIALAVASRQQLAYWRDSEALYRRAIAVTRANYVAHYGLAGVLAERGELAEARDQLVAAIAANPGWTLAYERIAQLEMHRGNAQGAREVLARLLELRPGDATLHAGLADLALRAGDPATAVRHYEEARRLRPGWLEPTHQLAWLRATHPDPTLRDPPEALSLAEQVAARSRVRDPGWLETLAAAHAANGARERAAALAREAALLLREAGETARSAELTQRAEGYRAGTFEWSEAALPRPPLLDPGDAPLR
jgi:tetratricopeptide (TPR) repeat protein